MVPGAETDSHTFRVDADIVIPGRGEPVHDGAVVVEGSAITYVGPRDGATLPEPSQVVRTLMPGLWDAHVHFLGLPGSDPFASATTPLAELVGRATRDLARTLEGGVTSVRDLGSFAHQLAPLVAEGVIAAPSIYGSGPTLTQTGGHGDLHALPDAAHRALDPGLGIGRRCDGVPECLRAVRLNLREGARVIKVHASGGIVTRVDDPQHQQFSDDELRAIVDEAGRAGRVVAAHCHGKAGIMAALRAGCHTIEHGSYIDDEAIDLFLERDAILVPTRFAFHEEPLATVADAMPAYLLEKLRPIMALHAERIARAIERGVRIAAGSDIYETPNYGTNGAEIRYLVELGMSPLGAIEAMTAMGPETLGPQAPRSGRLAVGFDADLIALDFDPTTDTAGWGDATRVTHVWQRGRLVKSRT